MSMSDYFENKVIDHMLRNQAYTPPTAIYVALFTANTGLESNAPVAEVGTGGGTLYARQAVTLSAAVAGASSNSADITFTAAGAPWGTIVAAALVDHPTNTTWGTNVNVLTWADLSASKTIGINDVFKFLATNLGVTMD